MSSVSAHLAQSCEAPNLLRKGLLRRRMYLRRCCCRGPSFPTSRRLPPSHRTLLANIHAHLGPGSKPWISTGPFLPSISALVFRHFTLLYSNAPSPDYPPVTDRRTIAWPHSSTFLPQASHPPPQAARHFSRLEAPTARCESSRHRSPRLRREDIRAVSATPESSFPYTTTGCTDNPHYGALTLHVSRSQRGTRSHRRPLPIISDTLKELTQFLSILVPHEISPTLQHCQEPQRQASSVRLANDGDGPLTPPR